MAYFVNLYVLLMVLAYILQNLAYSFGLKRKVVLDVLLIALGFIYRILAGFFATGGKFSPWMVILVFSIAIFLASSKRYVERYKREEYKDLALEMVNGAIVLVLMSWMLYLMDRKLYLSFSTVPLVYYSLYKVLYYCKTQKVEVSELVVSKKDLLVSVVLSFLIVLVDLYYLSK